VLYECTGKGVLPADRTGIRSGDDKEGSRGTMAGKEKKLNQRDLLADGIKRKIISGELKPGEKLPTERELSEYTGINKSAVHMAMKDLETSGFIKTIPRHGYYITDLTKDGNIYTMFEILEKGKNDLSRQVVKATVELRNVIEGGALMRLAKHHTKEDLKALQQKNEELREAVEQGADLQLLGAKQGEFHYLVVDLCGNMMFSLIGHSFESLGQIIWENYVRYWTPEKCIEQNDQMIQNIQCGKGLENFRFVTEISTEANDYFNTVYRNAKQGKEESASQTSQK
jgi:GntR family transcriptional repressor for pyruvate dehydrogenase complex